MTDDADLLRRYAEEKSDEAFAQLVRSHLGLVYSVALRQVAGDTHLAEDVAQQVFTALARKASSLRGRPALSGWLYRSTYFAARDLVRGERRRRAREQEVHAMNSSFDESAACPDWDRIRPVLDAAVADLSERERTAVALRFFDGSSYADVGARLQLSENGARMRVERALEKLRAGLAQRGITSTAAGLAIALTNQAGVAAPAGLAVSVTGVALAGAVVSGGVGAAAVFMGMTKLQIGIAGAIALAGGAGFFAQAESNANLRREIATLRSDHSALAAVRAENRQLASTSAEIEMLRRDDVEFERLALHGEQAKTALEERARRAAEANARAEQGRIDQQKENARRQAQALQQSILDEILKMDRERGAASEEYKLLVEKSKDLAQPEEAKAKVARAMQSMPERISIFHQRLRTLIQLYDKSVMEVPSPTQDLNVLMILERIRKE
jgi:RNA polymerase sigma factor (sigma-70 family)